MTFEISPERIKVGMPSNSIFSFQGKLFLIILLEGRENPKPQLPNYIATFEAPNTFRRKVKKDLGLEGRISILFL